MLYTDLLAFPIIKRRNLISTRVIKSKNDSGHKFKYKNKNQNGYTNFSLIMKILLFVAMLNLFVE